MRVPVGTFCCLAAPLSRLNQKMQSANNAKWLFLLSRRSVVATQSENAVCKQCEVAVFVASPLRCRGSIRKCRCGFVRIIKNQKIRVPVGTLREVIFIAAGRFSSFCPTGTSLYWQHGAFQGMPAPSLQGKVFLPTAAISPTMRQAASH